MSRASRIVTVVTALALPQCGGVVDRAVPDRASAGQAGQSNASTDTGTGRGSAGRSAAGGTSVAGGGASSMTAGGTASVAVGGGSSMGGSLGGSVGGMAGGDLSGIDPPLGGRGDAGGDGGAAGSSPTVAKFCNTLTFDEDSTTMILKVGTGPAQVTFMAATGECLPATGNACVEIPVGTDTPVSLFDADDPTSALDTGTVLIRAGQAWIFQTDVRDAQPIFAGGPLAVGAALTCEAFGYDDI